MSQQLRVLLQIGWCCPHAHSIRNKVVSNVACARLSNCAGQTKTYTRKKKMNEEKHSSCGSQCAVFIDARAHTSSQHTHQTLFQYAPSTSCDRMISFLTFRLGFLQRAARWRSLYEERRRHTRRGLRPVELPLCRDMAGGCRGRAAPHSRSYLLPCDVDSTHTSQKGTDRS